MTGPQWRIGGFLDLSLGTGCHGVMEPLLSSIIINTAHPEAMLKFYGRVGLTFEAKQVSKGGQCHKAYLGGVELTFFAVKETARPRSPDLQLTIRVTQLEEMVAELATIPGVECLLDPTVLPDGKKAILLDPDGRAVELVESV